MSDVGNWIGELTTTVGTGAISLGGKLSDAYSTFASAGITDVWYSIVDGDNRESGIGTISNGVLTRTTVTATISNGVYAGNLPGPINLSGLAEVYSTFNALAFQTMNADIATLLSAPVTNQDASEVPVTPNGGLTSTDVQAALEELQTEISVVNSGVETDSNFAWTGTHSFAVKLLPSDINLGSTYPWTGQHSYTLRTTVNGNTVYDEGNINEATLGINAQTANYTAVLADAGDLVTLDVVGAHTFTVPPNSSVAFPIGTVLTVRQKGVGQTTITEGAGVTITAAVSKGLLISEQGEWASIVKEGTDLWSIAGGLTA